MRKNLMRIASLALAFALMSVSAFALGGDYDASTGTFTVTGAEGALQTSLIIVEGAHDTLPVANEAVTGAVYIDQAASAADTGAAAFGGVSLPGEVYTAFFSNEAENSASSVKIVNAVLEIAADKYTVEEGQKVLISANRAVASFTVNGVADELAAEGGGYAFIPTTAGEYVIVATATVEGQTITSDPITITATEAPVVLDPVTIAGDDTILDLVKSPTSDYSAQPVGIKVNFGEGEKTIVKMKWVFESGSEFYFSADTVDLGIKVTGDAAFAAVVKNGSVVDGEEAGDAIVIDKVGAIFDVDGQDYYTNEAYGSYKDAE